MAYATLADFTAYGIVASAMSTILDATKQRWLDAGAERIDGYLRSRFPLPLSAWGDDLIEANVVIALWIGMNRRGFLPSAGSDVLIRTRYEDTISWLNRIGRQEVTPAVTPNTLTNTAYAAPRVLVGDLRGW